ncbi:MAG: ElyC/SanA/YdcF family protein [Burkholderiales bacterium]
MHLKPALFRRRTLWWPTWQGTIVLLVLLVLVALGFARHAAAFLALQAPAHGRDGQPARTLIVEGWMDEDALAQALAAFQRGGYARLISTGGWMSRAQDTGHWGSSAARGAAYMREHGVAPERVVAVPAPKTQEERTWTNAVMVRQWMQATGTTLDAADVYTASVHARRSRMLYQMALGDAVEVGVLAATPEEFDLDHWWRSSAGTKAVLGETLSWVWTTCCFWPSRSG